MMKKADNPQGDKEKFIPLTLQEIHEATEQRIEKIQQEFSAGFKLIEQHPQSVTFFGSARLSEDHPSYKDAQHLASAIVSTLGYSVLTGGGPGIMEAANKGAKLGGGSSIGLNISIPFEQFVNKWVDPELAFEFHYFFMRKFWFVYLAKAFIIFPGGFGTLDELMEVLTLIQTGKLKKKMKLIIYDSNYWKRIINFDALIEDGVISKSDLKLFDFCDTVDEAYEKVIKHMQKNYVK